MKTHPAKVFAVLLVLALTLPACAPAVTAPPVPAEVTVTVTPPVTVTPTPSLRSNPTSPPRASISASHFQAIEADDQQ